MADIESNINLNIDAAGALATLKELQRQISVFQTTMAKTGGISSSRLSEMQRNLVNNINSTGQFTASIQKVKTTTESFTQALEKNKLSMGQYFRYSLGATKTFGKGFKTEFDTIEKVARERVKTLQTQYIKLGRDANGAMQAIAVRPQVLDMKDLGTQTAIAAQKAQVFNQLMSQGSTQLLNFGKNTQWAGRQLMVGFTIPLGIMGAAAAREFQKIEEQVIRLERVYGDFTTTMADTEQITQQIKDLGDEFTKYGVAVSKTIGLAADAAAMGKTGADLVAQVAEANRLAVLGGVDQQQSLETTISLTNSFGVAAEELSGKINFLNAVENQTVTSIEDLTEAIPKAGPVVQQLGGNVEDLTFFLTAMKEGGINASEGANALKSGLASLINPTGEAAEMLAGFGINLQGIVAANKGNVRGIVVEFAKALDQLDPLNRAQAIEQLFGKFQFSRLSTLFQNVITEGSQASRVLDLTQASAAELAALSEKELGRIEASPLFKYQAAIEQFRAAIAPVGEEFMKAVTPLINFGTQILESFNSWSDGAKQFAVIAVGAVGAIGPILLMTFGLLANGFANIIKGILFVRNGFKGMGDQSNVLTEQLNYMNSEQLESAAISASLNQVHNNLIQTFTSEAGAVRNLAAAYGQAIASQAAFTGPIMTDAGMRTPKKYADGVTMVPGSGSGDTVPAMLTPGEAIIPAAYAKKYAPLINAMVAGNIPGYKTGKKFSFNGASYDGSQSTGRALDNMLADLRNKFGQVIPEIGDMFQQAVQAVADSGATVTKKAVKEKFDEIAGEVIALADTTYAVRGRDVSMASQTGAVAAHGTIKTELTPESARMIGQELLAAGKDSPVARALATAGDNTGISAYSNLVFPTPVGANDEKLSGSDWARWIRESPERFTSLVADQNAMDPSDPGLRQFAMNVADSLELAGSRAITDSDFVTVVGTGIESLVDESSQVAKRALQKSKNELATLNVQVEGSSRTRREAMPVGMAIDASTGRLITSGATPSYRGNKQKSITGSFNEEADTFVSGIVTRLRESFRRAFKINSPSKETDDIANSAMEGFEQGAQRGMDDVRDAGEDAAQAVAEGARRGARTNRRASAPGTAIAPIVSQGTVFDQEVRRPERVTTGVLAYDAVSGQYIDKSELNRLKADRRARAIARAKNIAREERKQNISQAVKGAVSPGKIAAAGMGISSVAFGASMMGGPIAEAAQGIMGPMMAISGVASLFTMMPPQIAAVVAALGAIVVVATSLQGAMSGAIDKAIKFGNSVGSSTKSINALAEATGSVTSSQVMDKQRSESIATVEAKNVKDVSFGQSYLENQGKSIVDSIIEQIKSDSSSLNQIHEQVYQQMSTAIVSGALNMDDAKSIVAALGEKLNDPTMAVSVIGKLTELMGPNGEKLSEGVFEVALDLQKQSSSDLSKTISNVEEQISTAFDGWNPWENMENLGTAAGTLATVGASAIQQQQALLDSLDLEYQKRIEIAKASGDQAKIQQVQSTYEKQRAELLKEQKNTIDTIVGPYEKITGKYGNSSDLMSYGQNDLKKISAMGEAVDKQITETYKGDPAQAALATTAKDAIVGASGLNQAQEFEMKFLLSTGDIPPQTFISLIDSFGEDSQQMTMAMNMVTNLGTADGGQALQLMNMFTNEDGTPKKDVQADFLAQMSVKTPEGAKETMDFYQQLLQNGGQEAVEMAIEVSDNEPWDEARQSIENLKTEYKEIEDLTANGPVTMEMVTIFDPSDMAAMKENADWFNSLDAVAQKYFLQHYVTVKATIDKSEVTEYLRNKYGVSKSASSNTESWTQGMIRGGTTGEFTQEQINSAAAQMAREQTQSFLDNNVVTGGSSGGGGGGSSSGGGGGGGSKEQEPQKPPTSFLDDLVKKMRDVQKASQKLTENFADSWAAISSMVSGTTNTFNGLQQQMRNLGAGEDLISLVAGMSPEEYEQRKNDLFNFDANGNITSFKNMLGAIGKTMRSIALGEFQNKQASVVQTTKDQFTAVQKLVAAGASYAEAYEIVADAATASAIANEDNAASIRTVAEASRDAAEAANALSAAQSLVASSKKNKDMKDLVGYLSDPKYAANISESQMSAILNDENLQSAMLAMFKGGTFDATAISQALADAAGQAKLDLDIKKLTISGMEEIFSDGMNKALEQVSLKEAQIKLKFEEDTAADQKTIKKAQEEINDIRNREGGIDDLEADLQRIADKEKLVNEKYDERYKALDKIDAANARIANREQAQLSIAQALSSGDIGAAAAAMQQLQADEAAAALADRRAALQKAQELELSQLTNSAGLTREQIEEKIVELKKQIFNIEEDTLEPAQQRIELAQRQLDAELEVQDAIRKSWEARRAEIDAAKTSAKAYTDAIREAVNIQAGLTGAYTGGEGNGTGLVGQFTTTTTTTTTKAPTTPAPTPAPVRTVDYEDMARRVYRGEYGNGQDRINRLRAAGFSDSEITEIQKTVNRVYYGYAKGGMVRNYLAKGGFPLMKPMGTDTVPAMLTPGEFVVRKYAVQKFGADNLKAINNGSYNGGSVYNNTYSINVNVKSDANANDIARSVMAQIKQVDAQRIRGNRF